MVGLGSVPVAVGMGQAQVIAQRERLVVKRYYKLNWRERIEGHGTVRFESHVREFSVEQYDEMIGLYNDMRSDRVRYPDASLWEVTQIA